MPSISDIQKLNRALADQVNAEALADPRSPYRDKFVGIANGKVVIVTDSLDDLDDALDRVEPDPDKTFFFEGGTDLNAVEYIWEMRDAARDLAAKGWAGQ